MPRIVKVYKNNEGEDIEVYSDECNICKKEMVFPKIDVDRVEEMFPFVKEKAERGSPCIECVTKQGKDNPVKVFSKEEIDMIKKTIMDLNKK